MTEPGSARPPVAEPTRLLLVRHGETDGNKQGQAQGRRDVPLNATGEEQAAAVATALSRYAPAAVIASDAQRARQTAAPIVRAAGCELLIDARLAEMDQGEFDGMSGIEMRDHAPDFMRRWTTEDPTDLRMPDGETLREVQTRALAAIREHAPKFTGRDVVIVSHNFTIRSLLCHALGVPLTAFRRFEVGLASLAVIEWRAPAGAGTGTTTGHDSDPSGDRWAVVSMNDRCHVPGARA